jgi:hypothetical protein
MVDHIASTPFLFTFQRIMHAHSAVISLLALQLAQANSFVCRGVMNPETGMPRVLCDDSVAWGKYGSFEPDLVNRFHGEIGQRYTVECPDNCRKGGPVWGCNPFLDESSICKAAVGMGKFSNDKGIYTYPCLHTAQLRKPDSNPV